MKWIVGLLICVGAGWFVLTQHPELLPVGVLSAPIEGTDTETATPHPAATSSSTVKATPAAINSQPAVVQLQPMPAGFYCLLERISMTTDSGIISIPAGTSVRMLKTDALGLSVTDGDVTFHVKLSQVTKDPALAARISQAQTQNAAALAAWQQSQSAAAQAQVDANNAAAAKIAAFRDSYTPVEWLTDYQLALQQAASQNKRLLLDFTGSDWCQWCMKTDADIFSKREFMDYAAKNFVLVKLDYPQRMILPDETKAQNERMRTQFNITGYPTLIVLDKNGAELGRMSGYYEGGPGIYLAKFEGFKKP